MENDNAGKCYFYVWGFGILSLSFLILWTSHFDIMIRMKIPKTSKSP